MQSACRDTQTLAKHALGLYDIRTFNETKDTLQKHLDAFVVCVALGAVTGAAVPFFSSSPCGAVVALAAYTPSLSSPSL